MKPVSKSVALPRLPHLYAVILAGGRGERFWPVGRHSRPKQFVDIFGGKPLIAHAVDRLRGLVPPERIRIVTSRDLVRATRRALPNLPPAAIVGEPCGRDTAAACALGTEMVRAAAGDSATVAILTADHLMADAARFRQTLADAALAATARPVMALVGIKPTHPATGYGYVELGRPVPNLPKGFRKVARFVEKPDAETAAQYVASGRFAWNSGMFVWKVSTFRDALRKHRPELLRSMDALAPLASRGGPRFAAALSREYASLGKISVDYAIMEKADNLVATRGEFGWDDVGSWTSAGAHFAADADGNAVAGLVRALAASGNVAVNTEPSGHVIALLGVDNLVVVHTRDATLVASREGTARMKDLFARLSVDPATQLFVK